MTQRARCERWRQSAAGVFGRRLLMTAAVALVVVTAGCLSGGPAAIESAFDTGTEGWTVTGDAQSGSNQPTYHAEGGVEGGWVSSTDDTTGGVWYWNASSAYLGDRSAYAGGTLSFQLTQSKTDEPFASPDVILTGDGLRLGYDFGDASTHPGTEWTPYEVPLESAGWTNLETERPASSEELERVLASLDGLYIRGEYRTGSDVGGLDAVRLAPSPS